MQDEAGIWHTLDSATVFPTSGRGALIEGYLHDHVWLHLPPAQQDAFRNSLIERFPSRLCQNQASTAMMKARSTMTRISAQPGSGRPPTRRITLTFTCDDRTARVLAFQSSVPYVTGNYEN